MENDALRLVSTCEKKLSYMATYMAMHDRFNYEVFTRMKKVADPGVSTAGVEPDGVKVVFRYNPKYISNLSIQELAYVVSHNVGHVVMHHFDRNPPAKDGKARLLYDIAADMAINSLFRPREGVHNVPYRFEPDLKLPNGDVLIRTGMPDAATPAMLGFDSRLSMERYYDLLVEKFDETGEGDSNEDSSNGGDSSGGSNKAGGHSGDSKSGPDTGDDSEKEGGEGSSGKPSGSHDGWKKDTLSEAMAKEWVDLIDRTNAWGGLPGHIKGMVRAAQHTSIHWSQYLREKLGEIVSKKMVSTYKRPSRRFGYPWCGKKTATRDKKLVLIDTSGSIKDSDIASFVAEIDRLAEEQAVYYMTFDEELHMEEALEWHPGLDFSFGGRGGTDVRPGLEYAKENSYSDCIILTDGYFQVPEEPDGVSVLWVITYGGNSKPAPFGDVVFVEKNLEKLKNTRDLRFL